MANLELCGAVIILIIMERKCFVDDACIVAPILFRGVSSKSPGDA